MKIFPITCMLLLPLIQNDPQQDEFYETYIKLARPYLFSSVKSKDPDSNATEAFTKTLQEFQTLINDFRSDHEKKFEKEKAFHKLNARIKKEFKSTFPDKFFDDVAQKVFDARFKG